jgi:pilus assembly protein CpaB
MAMSSRATQLGALGFFAIALGCGAFAAFLIARVVNAKGYNNDKTQPVVVAKHNLPAAQPLTEADVEVVNWPEKHIPPGVSEDTKSLFSSGKPLIPTVGILEGEPIVQSRLANSAAGTGIAALVHEGFRAMAVKVDDAVGRSGLVYPGAHVDVVVTTKDQEGHTMTRIAVGDALVLAVEAETDVSTRKMRNPGEGTSMSESNNQGYTGTVVTIEVGPDDAQVIALAGKEGHIDLALRNGSDRTPASTKVVIPIEFSSLPPDTVGLPLNLPPGAAPPPTAIVPTKPPMPGGKTPVRAVDPAKRIELRAVDDKPKSEIETYHAH